MGGGRKGNAMMFCNTDKIRVGSTSKTSLFRSDSLIPRDTLGTVSGRTLF